MSQSRSVYRIIDASLNRCAEGLRTLEEAGRFILDDAVLSSGFKSMRHELASIAALIPRNSLLESRDTSSDVGTVIEAEAEYLRSDFGSVVAAASSRVQQSVRVLEEYGKVIDPTASRRFEQIRYRLYSACAELELSLGVNHRKHRLQDAFLYVLCDAGESDTEFERKISELAKSSIDVVQLRDQAVSDRLLLHRAQVAVKILRKAGKLFIVNDRPDIAVAADADGVHVGQAEIPVPEARMIVGRDRLVGVSTHQISEAKRAVQEGADYLGCGPVFPSKTKKFEQFVGVTYLDEVASLITIPCFAIGGIDLSNLQQVLETGFHRIAVSGAINHASDPTSVADQLRDRLVARLT
ncbi:thiamine phosphate synthase [Rhodopirellula sp.]|nr:thiamine phosphate synthase [Rhodopirellula sp.]